MCSIAIMIINLSIIIIIMIIIILSETFYETAIRKIRDETGAVDR
jgi:hypothetical protein